MGQDYFLGLDMGTGSLGWAVTDDLYQVLRRHGKSLWGVRLFESANTAEERRLHRTARRNLDRRGWRIQVLQELFAEEISKVDPGFFLRMKESKYYPEDKRDADGKCPELPYALFVDKTYTDKEYHKEFPTIYHLRKMLMETETMPDIRLVYLALHHMMKHRGHFLLSGDIGQVTDFTNTFHQMIENIHDEELDFNLVLGDEEFAFVKQTLKDRNLTRSAKKTQLIKMLKASTVCEKAILNLVSGGTVKLSDIFGREDLDSIEKPKICFADAGYDDYIAGVEGDVGEQFYIIASAKSVYDWSVLTDILGDSVSISEAKVKTYEKHKKDLAFLKKVIRDNLAQEDYKETFLITDSSIKNYSAYIGMVKKNGKKIDLESKRCSREEFMDFLKKRIVAQLPDGEEKDYLMEEIEKDSFLPKPVNKDNSVIPYQIQLYELKKILENLGAKSEFIKENTDKIIQLFTFRIPYYVGPLHAAENDEQNKFSWAVRKSNEKIYPWNFEEVIDTEESAQRFIRRMTNKCTYLYGEDVLPKDSLLYSKFMVLNELNNLRLDGEKVSVELKQKLYDELFCKTRKVTQKKLRSFLVREGIAEKNVEISGIDGDFKASLKAYHDFKEKLTGVALSQADKEEIILNIVLFGDDKKLLKQRIRKKYPNLTDNQMKALMTLSYQGWGRLSKKFLEEVTAPAPGTGEVWSIMNALWETNDNLMQLLREKYKFTESVEMINSGQGEKTLSYETIQNSYASPSVKRQIWQTLQVVKEIQSIMGDSPKRVFVEMAREKQESKRTESRKKRLIDLYKVCQKEEPELQRELDELTRTLNLHEENQLRSDKLYLYYTQMGRCMYSGDVIPLEDLWDNTKYDIDHIYPQSKTMDDSLDNRVLVKKEYNAKKSDTYPLSAEIQKKWGGFWKMLWNKGFISKKKYDRLMRREELTATELAGFIERQIVETRQSTKLVAEILKEALPDTEIVYVKAGTVSRFRQTYDFMKVREMNDLHHAKDAYLNIVVGNTYFVKFTKNAAWFIRENPGRTYNLDKMFERDTIRDGETAWKAGNQGSIVLVRKMMDKNNILVTRRSYEVKGGLFDQMIMKKGKGQIPIKGSDDRLQDISKYGGYNKAAGAYFMLVESQGKKGELQRTIEYVPIYLKTVIESSEESALEYLQKDRGLVCPRILLKKIKTDTLFKVDGFYMWLSGRTGKQLIFKGANQLLLNKDDQAVLKKVLKYVQRLKENKTLKITDKDEIVEQDLLQLYDTFVNKLVNSVYAKRLKLQGETLTQKRSIFIDIPLENKCIVLSEILHLFQCQSIAANLKQLGGPASAGLLYLNSNISGNKRLSIVNQSITGVYEQEIDLLTV